MTPSGRARSSSGTLYASMQDYVASRRDKPAVVRTLAKSLQPPRPPPQRAAVQLPDTFGQPVAPASAMPPEAVGSICCNKIPGDNSCLFQAILTAVGDGREPIALRNGPIPDYLESFDDHIFQALLPDGFPTNGSRTQYKEWIRHDHAWGGALELKILSERYYGVQICVVHVPGQPNRRMDKYPEQPPQNVRIYVLYNGTHYDCVMPVADPDGRSHAGLFRADDQNTERKVLDIAPNLEAIMNGP